MLSGALLRKEGPDEEGQHERGGRHVHLPQHLHGPDQAVVVVSVRVSQPQSPLQDCGSHLICLRPPLHHRPGRQHSSRGQSSERSKL